MQNKQNFNTESFLKSTAFKILFPVVIAALIISLWQNGYEFGQYLQKRTTPENTIEKQEV
jgi:hypothetical protein